MPMSQRVSVLHLISSTSFFGAENVVCELAKNLDPSQFKCTVGLLGSPQSVADLFGKSLDQSNAAVVTFPCCNRFSWTAVRHLARFLKHNHIDLVHSHGYKSNFYSLIAARLSRNARAIATNHNWIVSSKKEKIYRCIDIWVLKRLFRVVGVSEDIRNEMLREGISPNLIRVIPNGISCDDPAPDTMRVAARKEFGIPDSCFVVGCVASLTPEKAHQDLFRAFSRVIAKVPDSMLLLVGDGPLHSHLVTLARSLGIHDRVKFLGYRTDVRALYSAFDVFALVSHTEGLPMSLLEAMAASLSVVVSRVGAIPEIVVPMKSGFLITPGDLDGIMNALRQLSGEREFRKMLGRNARDEVVRHYSVQRMARDYESLYRESLENKA
jgi:glycosyltransferase involved in cell wall biosynthesis